LVVVHAIYLLLVYFVDRADLITLMNGVMFSVAVAVVATFSRDTIRIIATGDVDREDYLLLGIIAAWASDVAVRFWTTLVRYLGRPEGFVDHPILALFLLWGIVGGVLHLTAPNAIKGKVPTRNWIKVGAAVGIGTVLAFLILWVGFYGKGH
jgi:hypothetical protein